MRAGPLSGRAFRRFFLGRSLSLVGDAVVPAALALALLRATGSVSSLALVLGCAMVPKLVLLPVGGVVADRLNARTVAVATDLVRCGMQLLVGLQLLGSDPSIGLIAAAEVVGGAASAFATPALSPLVSATVAAEHRQRANSLLGTAGSVARLGGPALAGLLIWSVGPGWAFILDAGTFAASAALLLGVRIAHAPLPKRSFRSDLMAGWAEVRSRDWYWTSLVAHGIWNLTAAVFMVLGPAIAVRSPGGEGSWVAVLQSGSIGVLVGALLAGRCRVRRPVAAGNLAAGLYALPLAALAASAPAPVVIGAYGVAMAGLGFLGPVWETTVQNTIPEHALARVMSYDWLMSLGAMPVGYFLAPLAAEAWGSTTTLTASALLVGGACVATLAVPGVRRFVVAAEERRTEPVPDEARETEPVPDGARETEPVPDGARETEPVPDGARETEPVPDGARETEPVPDGARETVPAPDGARETEPADVRAT
ncbi:MFS transporter [Streptomyces sp. PBH53]|uniref:MFS transporter n=1 Tax=Streptomyces sp. PBH53 TaxID=1577075 RepID=UPI000A8F1D39|nr:MFS transporter [Streptomyces sp. PBH53]